MTYDMISFQSWVAKPELGTNVSEKVKFTEERGGHIDAEREADTSVNNNPRKNRDAVVLGSQPPGALEIHLQSACAIAGCQ